MTVQPPCHWQERHRHPGEQQQAEAYRQKGVPEVVEEVQDEEHERPQYGGGEPEGGNGAAGEGPLAEKGNVEHGCRLDSLGGHKGDQQEARAAETREYPALRPASLSGPHKADNEDRDGAAEQDKAPPVKLGPGARVPALSDSWRLGLVGTAGGQGRRFDGDGANHEGEGSDRHVDEEDPPPAKVSGDEPPD